MRREQEARVSAQMPFAQEDGHTKTRSNRELTTRKSASVSGLFATSLFEKFRKLLEVFFRLNSFDVLARFNSWYAFVHSTETCFSSIKSSGCLSRYLRKDGKFLSHNIRYPPRRHRYSWFRIVVGNICFEVEWKVFPCPCVEREEHLSFLHLAASASYSSNI